MRLVRSVLAVFGVARKSSSCDCLAKQGSSAVGIKFYRGSRRVHHSSGAGVMARYSVVEKGSPNSLDYRAYFVGDNGYVSPFHDIPLYHDNENHILNMVVEVPRWTNAKMEISRDDKLNPIKQDIKKGKLRYVDNCFPHHGYIWNYGALPQTWEDPNHTDSHTELKGDNDPLDVCEIGYKVYPRGSVIQVKPLGIMALIDEGETDWKIIAIDIADPMAQELNDIHDVEKKMPGLLKASNEWFRIYKIPTGKPENKFAFQGELKNKEFALTIVNECHEFWKTLITKQDMDVGPLSRANTTVTTSPFLITMDEACEEVDSMPAKGCPACIPPEVDKWNFITLDSKTSVNSQEGKVSSQDSKTSNTEH